MKLAILAGLLALFSTSAQAQQLPLPASPLSPLEEFLQLTPAQVQTIVTNNQEYNRWSTGKQTRITQVQWEIVTETTAVSLDAHALGVRHMEVELICREMRDRAAEFRTRNLAVLSPGQQEKLKTLQDTLLLIPALARAHSANLLPGLANESQASFPEQDRFVDTIAALILTSVSQPVNGCSTSFSMIMRAGNFSNPFKQVPAPPPSR